MATSSRAEESLKRWVYGFLFVFFATITVFILVVLSELLLPIIVGALLAYICKPLVKKNFFPRLPKWIGTTVVFSSLIFGVVYLVKQVIARQPDELQRLELMVRAKYKINQKYENLMAINFQKDEGNFFYNSFKEDLKPIIAAFNKYLNLSAEQAATFEKYRNGELLSENDFSEKFYGYHIENLAHPIFGPSLKASIEGKKEKVELKVEQGQIKEKSSLGKFIHLLSVWFLAPLVFLFMLIDKGEISKFFVRLVPNKYFEMSLTILDEVDMAIGNYLRSTLLECSMLGATIGFPLILVGIDPKVSLVIGLLAGATHAIPFLGGVVGLGAGVGYAIIAETINPIFPFVTLENLPIMVSGVILFAIILDNAVYQPLVIGGAVHLHPLVVIIAVIGGSFAFGVVGMLFAIPSIVILKTVIETSLRELKAYHYL
jgi:predicted PurR-regulated permease PerM